LDQVRLPDLEVIKRFSIAVRTEHAPIEEVLEALRADLARISGTGARPRRDPAAELADRDRRLPRSGQPKPAAKAKPKTPPSRGARRR
jgi:hypothetical protein